MQMYNLEIKEVVIVHCNVISNDFQNYIRVLYIYLFLIYHLVNYEIFYSISLFLRTFNSERSYNENGGLLLKILSR